MKQVVYNDHFGMETGQASDVGRIRAINEDSFLPLPESGLWVVADGMGGHAAGDFASQKIVHELITVGIPATGDDLQARVMERVWRANEAILAHAAELGSGTIGATLVALLVHGDAYACIWSGDSRIYRLRGTEFEQVTRDHTEVQMLLDSGAISPEEAENWPRKNVITRAIGVSDVPECDVTGGVLQHGDRFLLCSDGLTEHMEDHEIARVLGMYPPQVACDRLIETTLQRGARDNVTVVAVEFTAGGMPMRATDWDGMEDEWA